MMQKIKNENEKLEQENVQLKTYIEYLEITIKGKDFSLKIEESEKISLMATQTELVEIIKQREAEIEIAEHEIEQLIKKQNELMQTIQRLKKFIRKVFIKKTNLTKKTTFLNSFFSLLKNHQMQ